MTADRVFFFIVQRKLSNEYFISFVSCVTEFHCVTNAFNHFLNPQELGRMVVALLRS